MNEIKCMIVDDEPIARDILVNHIANTSGLILVKSCINAIEAYEGLYEYAVSLIFLDIQMPVIAGTDFLRSLRNPPLVIFTTAYQDYAVESFELNSVDYLLKPITYERFHQAVEKARERLDATFAGRSHPAPTNGFDYLFVKQGSRLTRVNHNDIHYIEAEKDFSAIFLQEKKLLAGMHLKMFEDLLPGSLFMRVHRSYIVNLSRVTAINVNMAELGKTAIPIGGNYKADLLRRLGIGG
ncbi:MAG: response regulator transcription factor [Chitinophagaceae bacterium]